MSSTEADPVLLEIFNNLFMSIAEQMGARLESTAQSVNIKERLDFSCALFDPDGNLVANAPHIPVHLGSMGTSVKEVIRRRADRMKPGDAYAVNDPYHGGTHLPDVTVVTPVFDDRPGDGRSCSSSPPAATTPRSAASPPAPCPRTAATIDEEGVLFDNWLLVENGRFREEETLRLLTEAPYPSRNPTTNLADLRAQIAANPKGVEEVGKMIDHFGLDVVQAYMRHVQDNAEEAVRRVIDALDDGEYRYETDSGAVDRGTGRAWTAHSRSATIDFTGTSPQLDTNFNAPTSVVDRGRPVRLPDAGRRRHPAQRRLPAPAADRRPAGLDARADLPGRRRRRQRRDVAGDHRRALRRAGRPGRGLRHDEQRHLRQRAAPVLRDRRPPAPAPATGSTGRRWCRPT